MFAKKTVMENLLKDIYQSASDGYLHNGDVLKEIQELWKKANPNTHLNEFNNHPARESHMEVANALNQIATKVREVLDKDNQLKKKVVTTENEIQDALAKIKTILEEL